MTCYKKKCAFHCKLCDREKKKCGSKPNIKNRSLKTCHFTNVPHWFPPLSTAKGCPIVTDQTHTHTHARRSYRTDKSSNAASSFICFAWWPSHNQLTCSHSDRSAQRRAHTQERRPDGSTPTKKMKNWRSPPCVFCDASNCQWPWCDLHTPCRQTGGGLKWGERACVCVRASFQAACSDDEVVP